VTGAPTVVLPVFAVIFVAELPDKTAIAALLLATRHKALPVFLGAALALTVQSVIAVGAGQLLSLLPAHSVHLGAGLLFWVTAVVMWRRRGEDDSVRKEGEEGAGFWRTLGLVFGVVFVAEWGDLTQLATAALAAHYAAPVRVFLGATAALWSVVAIAVFVGSHARKYLSPRVTQRVAAGVFAAVGVALVTGLL
jgi:putative Ca2+/H+ antiporter (TMEM165/GDT1 family)